MCNIEFSSGSTLNITWKITMNTRNEEWIISGCTLHDSVNTEYCKSSCVMKEHCKVYIALMREKIKEKVHFT